MMQYASIALSLAWPQIVVGILWLVVGLASLRYRLATQRPSFSVWWNGCPLAFAERGAFTYPPGLSLFHQPVDLSDR